MRYTTVVVLAGCLASSQALGAPIVQVLDGGLGEPFVAGPAALALAPDGTLYIGSSQSRNIIARAPDGTLTEILGSAGDGATMTFTGGDLTLAPDGTLYASSGGGVFRVSGGVVEVALESPSPSTRVLSLEAGPSGDVFVGLSNPPTPFALIEPDGDIAQAMDPAALSFAVDLAVDSGGTFYASGYFGGGFQVNRAIAARAPDGSVTYVAGPGVTDSEFRFLGIHPQLAVDFEDNLFAADRDRIRKRTPSGSWSTLFFVGDPGAPPYQYASALETDLAGRVYALTNVDPALIRVETSGSAAAFLTTAGDGMVPYTGGSGLAVAPDGTAFVADSVRSTLFRVDPDGEVTRLLGPLEDVPAFAKLAWRAGQLWVADVAHDRVLRRGSDGSVETVLGPEGDGAHPFEAPGGIAVDGDGNLWAAGRESDNVFRVSPAGVVTQMLDTTGDGAASLDEPRRLAIAPDGGVVVAGYGSDNVFRIALGGGVTELFHDGDGGIPLVAPSALAFDGLDVLVAGADSDNVLRLPDGGPALQILDATGGEGIPLDQPTALGVGPDGTVWIASRAVSTAVLFRVAPGGAAVARIVPQRYPLWKDLVVAADGTAYASLFGSIDSRVLGFPPDGGTPFVAVDSFGDGVHALVGADGLALDDRGGLNVAGQFSHNILRVQVPEPDTALMAFSAFVALAGVAACRRGMRSARS